MPPHPSPARLLHACSCVGTRHFPRIASQVLATCKLLREDLQLIWDLVDTEHVGSLSRIEFYRALAFVAVKQVGTQMAGLSFGGAGPPAATRTCAAFMAVAAGGVRCPTPWRDKFTC